MRKKFITIDQNEIFANRSSEPKQPHSIILPRTRFAAIAMQNDQSNKISVTEVDFLNMPRTKKRPPNNSRDGTNTVIMFWRNTE